MGLHRKAFWPVTGGIVIFADVLILIAYSLGLDPQLAIVTAASFTFIVAPLTAWLTIFRIGGGDVLEP